MFRSTTIKLKNQAAGAFPRLISGMKTRAIFLFCIIFFALISFVSAQDTFVSLGSGGGFAGTATVYKVTPNGLIFKGDGIGDIKYTLCGKIKKGDARKIIARVADKARATAGFSHPGNLYYFIGYTENEKQQTLTWGDANHPVPDEVKKLYEDVYAIVSEIKYRPIQ